MNSKVQKYTEDIAKTKAKIQELQGKLRELEKLKNEAENAGLLAILRSMKATEPELQAFAAEYTLRKTGTAMPNVDDVTHDKIQKNMEETV